MARTRQARGQAKPATPSPEPSSPKPSSPEPSDAESEPDVNELPTASFGVHWCKAPNPPHLQTGGLGWLCLLQTNPGKCRHFTSRVAFDNHMRIVHLMQAPEDIKGRPKSSIRTRYGKN